MVFQVPRHSGIEICENIFIDTKNSIKKDDTNLTLIGTLAGSQSSDACDVHI